tara:strand:- start:11 stop:178 length:168 start_codon:yes stop_codon:yes gene_type:complete
METIVVKNRINGSARIFMLIETWWYINSTKVKKQITDKSIRPKIDFAMGIMIRGK